ncbi:MAG: DnaJ domain-containing protein [Sphingomicrobium sp.]
MTSAVGLRSNHYETLGVRPDATASEIERAFRNELHPFMPHVLGGVAAASVAYATLRDPAKRRAYDVANGFIIPRPPVAAAQPVVAQAGWAMGSANVLRAVPRPAGTPFIAAPEECATAEPPSPPPLVIPPVPAVARAPVTRRSLADEPRPAPIILGMDEAEDAVIDGRKGLLVIGAIGAVALVGGLLGWVTGSDADGVAGKAAVVAAVPKAGVRDLSIITPVAIDPALTPQVAAVPTARPKAVRRALPSPNETSTAAATAEVPAVPTATESGDPPVDALAPRTAPPEMPLPSRTIARTIDRIGYVCGAVTATESAGGGIYTVSCSSGQRFRASPRNGRYRFKRV